MINIRIVDEVSGALKNVQEGFKPEMVEMLDNAAIDTLRKMTEEAPESTGELRAKIKIDGLGSFLDDRIIYPDVNYAFYQETRAHMPQRRPPLEKIKEWAEVRGFDNKAAFLIARKIAQSGYPQNPFVLRTYRWVQVQIVKHAENFLNNIGVRYMAGREVKTFKL